MSGIGHDRHRATARAAARFPARYPSGCGACDEAIEIGQTLRWDGPFAVHADCGDAAPEVDDTEVCPKCFLAVAVNGACGCDA